VRRSFLFAIAALSAACSPLPRPSSSSSAEEIVSETTWAIVDAENRRDAATPALRAALEDPASRERALLALGRIGGADVVPILEPFLASSDTAVRTRAAYALSVAGSDTFHPEVAALARTALLARLPSETDGAARDAFFVALGFVGDATTASVFSDALASGASSGVLSGLATLLARQRTVTLSADVWTALVAIASETGDASEEAARALAYFPGGSEVAVPGLETLLRSKVGTHEVQAAGWIARAIGSIKSAPSEVTLATLVADPSLPDSVVAYAAEGLPKQSPSAKTLEGLTKALAHESPIVVRAALTGLPPMAAAAAPLAPALARIVEDRGHPGLAASALSALLVIDPAAARPLASAATATNVSPTLRDAAVAALATTDPTALLPLCDSEDARTARVALSALSGLSLEALKNAFGPNVATEVLTPLFQRAIAAHDEARLISVGFRLGELGVPVVDAVVAELPRYRRVEQIFGRAAVVRAISDTIAQQHLPVLRELLHDPARRVALDAAAAIKKLTNEDVASQATPHNAPSFPTPSRAALNDALRARVVFETPRGPITFRMLPDAPLMASKFVEVASRGTYDGNPVHRVVSNWVAQGGAASDGTGHQDFLVPDEPAPTGHGFGYVGLATAGKDTGSAQYFIDLASNHRLDASYSSFAVVESGMDAALSLEQGDAVTSARVLR
jgi:cyclophilin family peptidyl-prolyl cis-trans isomerase/HEAT repeat protein